MRVSETRFDALLEAALLVVTMGRMIAVKIDQD
jgi:hypothetical protein